MKTYSGWFGTFSVDLSKDFYGDAFWEKIANKSYEPDTLAFLEGNLNPNTDFIDVGAATGSISIIAAKLGSRVLSFEAVPRVYEIAKSHIILNPDVSENIELRNEAISNKASTLVLGEEANPDILSSISNEVSSGTSIVVRPLTQAIDGFHQLKRQLVLKIDIEGAEWKLLSDVAILEKLSERNARVLLAIHPGFNRPFRTLPLGLTFLSKKVWQIQNAIVALRFFTRLMKFAEVRRTNLDLIASPKKCILLMFGGYFEFILQFKAQ